jgi:hypothetical protein
LVEEGDGASDGVQAVGRVLVLPDPPDAVDHAVVQEECGVARRGEEISAWVTADGVVS